MICFSQECLILKKNGLATILLYYLFIMNHSCFTLKLVYTLLQVHYIH